MLKDSGSGPSRRINHQLLQTRLGKRVLVIHAHFSDVQRLADSGDGASHLQSVDCKPMESIF